MILSKKKNKRDFIDVVTHRSSVLPVTEKEAGLDFLVSFFGAIRPSSEKGRGDATKNMETIINELHAHPVLLTNLQHALISQLIDADLSSALTESGIPLAKGFWQEFFGRLRHKLLPPLQRENDFLYVVNRVFFRKSDYQWVEKIPYETWVIFFENVRLSFHIDDWRIFHQLIQSLKILAFQVAQLGLEKEVVDYMTPSEREKNPFILQNYLIHDLEEMINSENDDHALLSMSSDLNQVIQQCYSSIQNIRQNHSIHGTSLHQTYTLILLENKLDRITILLEILGADQYFDNAKFVSFFKMLVRNENRKTVSGNFFHNAWAIWPTR